MGPCLGAIGRIGRIGLVLLHFHQHLHALVTCGAFTPEGEFLAEFTQHIPPKGAHLIRYYGWYSNKARGLRRKQAEAAAAESPAGSAAAAAEALARRRASQTWDMLIKRVYEVDPLACPECGGVMKVGAFIEPPQGDVIGKILRGHRRAAMVGGLWHASSPRPPHVGCENATRRQWPRPRICHLIGRTPLWRRPKDRSPPCFPNLSRLRSGSSSEVKFPIPYPSIRELGRDRRSRPTHATPMSILAS